MTVLPTRSIPKSGALLPFLLLAACGGGGSDSADNGIGGSSSSSSGGVSISAPSVPDSLSASGIATGSVMLAWAASTDGGGPGIGGYFVYRNSAQIATVSSTSYADSGLTALTAYSYQVAAFDLAASPNVSALSPALAVTTLADTQSPTVPAALAVSLAPGSATLHWAASSDLPISGATGVGGYFVYRDGVKIATVANGVSYTDAALALSSTYRYQLAAFDKAATPNVSALTMPLSVSTGGDMQAPTVPSMLPASALAIASVTINWSTSTDLPNPGSSGVGGYFVFRNGTKIATVVSGTSYPDSGLTAATTYSYRVESFDKAATPNVSALSSALNVTTLADTQPPTTPTTLSASAIATGSATVSWAASMDLPNPGATGVGGYYVFRNGIKIATVTGGTSYSNAPLSAATTYSYQIEAFDKAATANVSALSAPLSVTTLSDIQAPSVPGGLNASGVSACCATLHWAASTDGPIPGATGVGGYYVYRGGVNIATVVSGTSFADSTLAESSSYSYQVAAFDRAATPNVSALSAALPVTTGDALTLTPRRAALTLQQAQQFTTDAPGGTTLNWSVDSIAGGNSSVGTISSGGLYSAPAAAGLHTVSASGSTDPTLSGSSTLAVTDLSAVATYHNDLARTGQNLQEYALTPSSVASGAFGKRWSCPLDGTVYAQPLYVAHLAIGGGTHNVLFVVTMHDSVYAFDADNPGCVTYWQVHFVNPGAGITAQNSNCADTQTEYGITGTPVIDPSAQTLFLVAATNENGSNVQRLHALNLLNGAERANSPVQIVASVPGNGDAGSSVAFNAFNQNQRPGLALTSDGGVVISWASHCDIQPFHGWVMRFDALALGAPTAVFNATPNGSMGGIWMSGGAPALDSSGNMFLSTGNGSFNNTNSTLPPLAPNNNFGESFLNLNPSTLAVQDFYTPSQYQAWSNADLDISSGAVTVLPNGVGPVSHPNVLVGTDKQGHLWMIDRSHMSGYLPGMDNTVQYLMLPFTSQYAIHAGLAYWSGTVYVSVGQGPLLALQLSNGQVPQSGQTAIASSHSAENYNFPNPTPVISASPSGGAIVWALDNNANGTDTGSTALGPAILRAYDATDLSHTLYSSAALSADAGGNASKFMLPVVANGHVYVAGTRVLTVYGLAP